ncbi:helicase-primase helicase subunit [Felid alphaherpesvirus 1]|uniref:Helicase-primase helicase subunit n=1 Tax=Feline herpesvirus 1 TaxID=10334 RepID=D1FXX7_FHV1|nr:helicase-primase helicase subunit [Felid alphaherpesvirus 1]AMN88987.1 helicase-primase helicase subunit [synthetic construct]ACT88353.1 helicase-primase helicase subunit [Felid alphaherpesvirus 1]ALJ84065.1 helicase-primase helicase subunit [Felid alphaherpesvirus 1]ALJ84141.1 helicase-primase helicase subunit [Felid alphaherpesvirus 1]ALJ84217.1 helicase-primase helicase subunit [Felid alphaherpesvirus 1]
MASTDLTGDYYNDQADFSNSIYLNFTSMHGIRNIVTRIKDLAGLSVSKEKIPPVSWFKDLTSLETPLDINPRELPFSVYLISGNAGSGKSTCIQTLNETLECVITGATRVASQNVYQKLASSYSSRPVNTIFQEFGFRGNHVQAQLGKYQYVCPSNPPPIEELQKRDLIYYWEVLIDITKRFLESNATRVVFDTIRSIELIRGRASGTLASLAFCVQGSLPAFTKSNVIVIDEAGLLGRHLLTVVVYCWWMINAIYNTPQYLAGRVPVIVCIGSPTQTDSLESTFEHHQLKCRIRSSENILTYLITNKTLRNYTSLSSNWAIFINNKRCLEPEFGELMKVLEYGLPLTEDHMRLVDQFVVPDAFINNPANLPGWTRLYSSHKEVSAYMTKLHAHLRVSGERQFVVFTLPAYTFVRIEAFDEYRRVTGQPGLVIDKWLAANAGRVTNYSQSRDQDTGQVRCELHSKHGVVAARADITYVLNSQVTVTTRMKKLVFGFSGTFKSFDAVLKDDGFMKAHGETSAEYTYRFLSALLFSGMINFYNFLQNRELDGILVSEAYRRLAELTTNLLPVGTISCNDKEAAGALGPPLTSSQPFDFSTLGDTTKIHHKNCDDDDLIFAALNEGEIDLLYCNYEFVRPESAPEVYSQFLMLKNMFLGRYAIFRELFGPCIDSAQFNTYVDNLSFKGCEVFTGSVRGGLLSTALQTDSYTLMGYTHVPVHQFNDDLNRRRIHEGTAELLGYMHIPRVVLKDHHGFMSILNTNISEFVESIDDLELSMATTVDYGLSSKLAMTIARSQGLSLERVAICFTRGNLKLNSVYVAMSRTVSSKFLRMNLNPLRERHERDNVISEHILAALRDGGVQIVY